jgi:hypothetical protein
MADVPSGPSLDSSTLSIYLSMCLSTLSICLIYLPYLSIYYVSICLSSILSVYLIYISIIYLPIYLYTLSVSLSCIYLPVCHLIHPSAYLIYLLSTYLSIYLYVCLSMALQSLMDLGRFFSFLIADIHALSGIRTHDPSVQTARPLWSAVLLHTYI